MATSGGVWGIEIGQSALKALHCVRDGDQIIADKFDLIEYPKILSQPDADPAELIAEALQQLTDRNDSIRETVVISVPGQSGLAKFFKPPPVDLKKIADIVRYEAKQQIPFELADVVWDYQTMPGATIQEGYAVESEVGLFAMKREQAYRQLEPFSLADIEVNQVQLAPIALYNMIAYDRMNERIEAGDFDVDHPPPSTVLLSIGTDSSDLIVTNGFRIWQRSMPIGGNHFTRQLTKDLKMTFAKAEHLKRNAREAVDPKLVFQTMRPVFNDLVTEVQRSVGFFRGLNKKAEIAEMVIAGNTVKMPGLAAYLGKNLGYDVHTVDRFNRLGGEDVFSIPTFRDNVPTFAVCYGLCLQGLGLSQVHTSLVPKEIMTQRLIRAKKPWVLAGVAALMVGTTVSYAMTQRGWATTREEVWKSATGAVTQMTSYSSREKQADETLASQLAFLNSLGEEVSGDAERRLVWLEVLKAVNWLIPREDYPDGKIPSPKKMPMEERIDFHITEIDNRQYEDLATWFDETLVDRYRQEMRNWATLQGVEATEELITPAPPTGPGWVIQLKGYHYHNSKDEQRGYGDNHVRRYLTTNFLQKKIPLTAPDGSIVEFTPQEFGFSHPLLLNESTVYVTQIPNPDYDPEAQPMAGSTMVPAAPGEPQKIIGPDGKEVLIEPPTLEARRYDFVFQVAWTDKTISERIEAKRLAEEEAAAAAGEGDETNPDGEVPADAPVPDPDAVAMTP